jgi:hypothetical protein
LADFFGVDSIGSPLNQGEKGDADWCRRIAFFDK